MKVILTQDVPKLGSRDQIVNVKDGYGRNYLIPRGLAVEATPGAIRAMKERIEEKKLCDAREEAEARRLAALIEGTRFSARAKVGEHGKLFGSITSQDVADLISKQVGSQIDKRKVIMDEPIKSVGLYEIPIKLYHELVAKAKVEVLGEGQQEE